jgi:hypothetical protein
MVDMATQVAAVPTLVDGAPTGRTCLLWYNRAYQIQAAGLPPGQTFQAMLIMGNNCRQLGTFQADVAGNWSQIVDFTQMIEATELSSALRVDLVLTFQEIGALGTPMPAVSIQTWIASPTFSPIGPYSASNPCVGGQI